MQLEKRARVFISYSRKDIREAQWLRDCLTNSGLDPFLDVHDIQPGEPWRERLSGLIASAEKIVFLISPDSVSSDICAWEVDEAERQGKSILPVAIRETDVSKVPGRLTRLNMALLRDAVERADNLPRLIDALSSDLAWERRKVRVNDLAREWVNAGRPNRLLLLLDEAIREFEVWRDAHPPFASSPTSLQLEYIARSRRRYLRRQRQTIGAVTIAAMLLLATSIYAVFQQQEAVARRTAAELALEKQLGLSVRGLWITVLDWARINARAVIFEQMADGYKKMIDKGEITSAGARERFRKIQENASLAVEESEKAFSVLLRNVEEVREFNVDKVEVELAELRARVDPDADPIGYAAVSAMPAMLRVAFTSSSKTELRDHLRASLPPSLFQKGNSE